MANRLQVTRVITYRGDEHWVRETLARSIDLDNHPLNFGQRGSISEQPRKEEFIIEEEPKR